MTGARFKVVTCEGFLAPGKRGGGRYPGLEAVVLDSAYCHRIIDSFTSETRIGYPGLTRGGSANLGREAAIARANDLCAWLNRCYPRLPHGVGISPPPSTT